MGRRRGEVDGTGHTSGHRFRVGNVARYARFTASIGLVLAFFVGLAGFAPTIAEACKNEEFRTGRSANLPDCRAYELVTPENLGRAQDLAFSSGVDFAAVAADGEALALESPVEFGPEPSPLGARAVFTRTPEGWDVKSVVEPGASEEKFSILLSGGLSGLLSPDFSEVAFEWVTRSNLAEHSRDVTLDAGPVGGPYERMASVPYEELPELIGASGNFSDVLFVSTDHNLLGGPTGTDAGAHDLYDWTGGHLQLVNVQGGPLADPCGAELGDGFVTEARNSGTINAVSQDGSKIFFTSPDRNAETPSEPGCELPTRLYMRIDDRETIEVSEPEEVVPSAVLPVHYLYATPDGSKVFFSTQTVLTPGETAEQQNENKLFEYDTESPEGHRLRLIASGVASEPPGMGPKTYIFSEDGSAVYVQQFPKIYRYDTSTGERTTVAIAKQGKSEDEPAYTTPNGEFFLFTSVGVEGEPRGQGHNNQLYRYDNANGSVMCVSCGEGKTTLAQGEVIEPTATASFEKGLRVTQISEDGQEVFFQTTAQLVPQDTNSDEEPEIGRHPGLDVYEWEADGSGGCGLSQGCTYLLSSGEASGPSTFLGASSDGSNVFFATAARLVPQATPEFHNIYDARVEGGFPPPPSPSECSSCQGVGSPPPLFNTPASGSFAGGANPVVPIVEEKTKAPKKRVKSKHKKKHSTKHKTGSEIAGPSGKPERASRTEKRS